MARRRRSKTGGRAVATTGQPVAWCSGPGQSRGPCRLPGRIAFGRGADPVDGQVGAIELFLGAETKPDDGLQAAVDDNAPCERNRDAKRSSAKLRRQCDA